MNKAFRNLLLRVACAFAVHVLFAFASAALMAFALLFAERPVGTAAVAAAFAGVIFALLWFFFVFAMAALPSAVCGLVIYAAGGSFHERIAFAVAGAAGALVILLVLSSNFPAEFMLHLSTAWVAVLMAVYVACWLGVSRYLPKLS